MHTKIDEDDEEEDMIYLDFDDSNKSEIEEQQCRIKQ